MARVFIHAKKEVAEALSMVFSMRGHNPIWDENPRAALRQIITFQPKVVITEFLDLDIDGEWLCREIRKIRQLNNTQVIMMSELGKHLNPSDIEAMVLKFGANGYLRKPFPYNEIGKYLESWLRAS